MSTMPPVEIAVVAGSMSFASCPGCGAVDDVVVIQLHAVDKRTLEIFGSCELRHCVECTPDYPQANSWSWATSQQLMRQVLSTAAQLGRDIHWT